MESVANIQSNKVFSQTVKADILACVNVRTIPPFLHITSVVAFVHSKF